MHGSHRCFWNPLSDDTDGTFASETVITLYCSIHQSHRPTVYPESEQHHLYTHSVVVKSISDAALMYWDTLLSNSSRRSKPCVGLFSIVFWEDCPGQHLDRYQEIYLTFISKPPGVKTKGFFGSVETGIKGRELMMELSSARNVVKTSCVKQRLQMFQPHGIKNTTDYHNHTFPHPSHVEECGGLKIHVFPSLVR